MKTERRQTDTARQEKLGHWQREERRISLPGRSGTGSSGPPELEA